MIDAKETWGTTDIAERETFPIHSRHLPTAL